MLHKSGTIELYNINTTKNQASFLVKRVRQDERVHIKSRFHLSLTSVKYMNFSWLREILSAAFEDSFSYLIISWPVATELGPFTSPTLHSKSYIKEIQEIQEIG